jgi:deazaflavin-dependent oxidoreductase (nitroreductase family)
MRDRTAKQLSALHTLLYRATQGVLGRRLVKNDMLLLTTVGRRTNKPHTVPLLYLRDGGNLAVVASWGGRDNHPEWYLNLSAEPQVRVQVRSRRMEMAARTASPEERDRLWPQVLAAYDGYANYQSRTDREIPIVILTAR